MNCLKINAIMTHKGSESYHITLRLFLFCISQIIISVENHTLAICVCLYCMGSVKMNALNKCLMEYVSSQLSRDPSCNLMPVFNDYQSHASDISAMCSDKVDTPPSTSVAPPTSVTTGEQCRQTQQWIFNFLSQLAW